MKAATVILTLATVLAPAGLAAKAYFENQPYTVFNPPQFKTVVLQKTSRLVQEQSALTSEDGGDWASDCYNAYGHGGAVEDNAKVLKACIEG
ncbi:hypothetical protein NAC44_10645 [Allorhizobium sp. BGMRC 0089]|uniref:hypothetical protein n=1 Tax=Allorhizobium sonneratiae TaxID=2934936 RepID=UPI0020345753|nr:hypothetical protein [Allorhizobium sonneratiae]MCM2292781.1 hypothetical protein [Allorhizobium sonneratiae]